jgi:hypothetical protein
MRAVDNAVLAAMRTALGTTKVHDGLTAVRSEPGRPLVITYELPYAVFYSNVGDDHSPRLDGRTSRRSVFFSVNYVGLTRDQAKWAGEKIRDALEGRRLVVPGHRVWLVDIQESQRVRRDDDAIRPDGKPLFYGVDNYAVSITRVRQEAVA